MRNLKIWMLTALIVSVTSVFAQPAPQPTAPGDRDGRGIGPLGALTGGQQDPELARLTMDIMLLREINRMQLTPAQSRQVLTALEAIKADQDNLREEAMKFLLAERKRLVAGKSSDEEDQRARTKMKELVTQSQQRRQEQLTKLSAQLTPEQTAALERLIYGSERRRERPEGATAPAPASRAGDAPAGRAGPTATPAPAPVAQNPREERGGQTAGSAPGPRMVIVERMIELLKEKLKAG
jgi:Spy/CpxP family protein refolding chaperone